MLFLLRMHLMRVPRHNTEAYGRSFHLPAIRIYNENPDLFDPQKSINACKTEYKAKLIKSYFINE